MAKARKLKSGNWNVEVYDYTDAAGKVHKRSFTAPTKTKAEFLAAQFKDARTRRKSPTEMTVKDVVEQYLQLRSVLSPTTTSAYKHCLTNGFSGLLQLKVRTLTNTIVQEHINLESRRISRNGRQVSPKTVKNEWGTIAAALNTVCGLSFNVTLPKVQPKRKLLSPAADVLKAIKGTDVELPCLLSMWRSLRMSELRGLMYSDIQDGILSINRVKVDVDGDVVVKETTKTDSSRRSFPIPEYIMGLIKQDPGYSEYLHGGQDDYLVKLTRMQIYDRWRTICKHNNLNMTLHDLRSMYASIQLNVLKTPDKLVQNAGGWATDSVMKRVYSVAFDEQMLEMHRHMDVYIASQM